MIDYARMKAVYPKQKAALTRAQKKGYAAVLATCKATVKEWDAIGAWPDDWSRWQRALNDAFYKEQRETASAAYQAWSAIPPRLEEL